MGRSCSVCADPRRASIEQLLADGAGYRAIARQTGIDRGALARHVAAHLPAAVRASSEQRDVDRAESLHERLEDLYRRASRILDQAETDRRPTVALQAVRELRATLEFAAKVAGALVADPQPVRIELMWPAGLAEGVRRPELRAVPEGEAG